MAEVHLVKENLSDLVAWKLIDILHFYYHDSVHKTVNLKKTETNRIVIPWKYLIERVKDVNICAHFT